MSDSIGAGCARYCYAERYNLAKHTGLAGLLRFEVASKLKALLAAVGHTVGLVDGANDIPMRLVGNWQEFPFFGFLEFLLQ